MEYHYNTKYLFLAAKIKSDVLQVLMQLEHTNGCSKEEAASELRGVVSTLVTLE